MEIGYFLNFSMKHMKVIKVNALTFYSIHYFRLFLISHLLFCFYYTILKNIMKVMFLSVLIYTFFKTCVFLKDIFRRYCSYIFSIFVVYLSYHIMLVRLISDIELNQGPKPSYFKYISICHWNLNSITFHDFLKLNFKGIERNACSRYYSYLRIRSSLWHLLTFYCVKSFHIWSYSRPYFPAFRLNTDQNNSKYWDFSRSARQAMINWIYLVIISPMLIVLLEIDVGQFAVIIESLYLLKC